MIKEMNIVMVEEQNIEGVNNVPVAQIGIVSNGYVEKMSLYCLDNMVLSDRNKVFAECCKKTKVGGEIQIRFVNLDLIPKQIRSGDLTSDKYSAVLPSIQSVWSENDFKRSVQETGYEVDSMHYEGIYTVATITKL
jgi:hypothetical protein